MHVSPLARAGAAALALAAAPAVAQDVEILGTLTGTVDGASRSWYVTAAEMQGETVSQSDFTGNPAGSVTVSLFGHATESVMNSADSILLSFSVSSPDAPRVSGAEITYGGFSKVDGQTGFYNSGNDGQAQVVVTSFGPEGDRLRIGGTFSGTMPFRATTAREPDTEHVVTVTDGRFDALILPLSF
jgi:hypothetical protein